MNVPYKWPCRAGWIRCLLLFGLLVSPCAWAEKVSFRQAIELALQRSAGMGIALADQVRAHAGYREARNTYVPQVIFGSGLAKTWGFPMSIEGSAPSVFNITSQSFLLNWAQRQFVRAARTDWLASSQTVEDQRAATILETSLACMQLNQAVNKLIVAQREAGETGRAVVVSQERLQEGVDSKVDVTRANLNHARARMRLAEAQGNVDLLRQRLAQLTGLDVREFEIDPNTIPAAPEVSQEADLAAAAVANSPMVKAADHKAAAAELRAKGERRQLYPAIDLVGNYGLFTKYNNYDQYFARFSRHNATVGVAIRLPFLNSTQRAHAELADAEALKAQKEADMAREQVANEALKLQRSSEQLKAARDVAELEYQLAQANVDTVHARVQSGQATINDEQAARIDVIDKYAVLLDAQFELDRVRLQLLRATGELEGWAMR
ncbi:MAG: TolC family protein [Terriglobales bacterium]